MRGLTRAQADALRQLYGTDDPDGERAPRLPERTDHDGIESWSADGHARARFYCNRDHPAMRPGARTNRVRGPWGTQEEAARLKLAHDRRHHPERCP